MTGAEASPELTVVLATRWDEFWPGAMPLFELHQKELGQTNGLELDEVRCRELFAAGNVIAALTHFRGVLVGYCIFFLTPALDRRGMVVAEQGPFFVVEEFRNSPAGLKMWHRAMSEIKNKGACEAMVHLFEKSPQGLRRLYERAGGKIWAEIWRIEL